MLQGQKGRAAHTQRLKDQPPAGLVESLPCHFLHDEAQEDKA